MNASLKTQDRRAGVAARRLALGALLVALSAIAQEPEAGMPAPLAMAGPPIHGDKSRDAGRWDLPRLFYEPRQRRALDAQDRSLHPGVAAAGAAPSGPRFDGWLSGPAGTHAWVSGASYLADRAGRLHAARERAAEPGTDEMENAQAQLDKTRGVLVVHRETEGTLRLRVGEAESPTDAAPPASEPAPALAAPDRR
jgi:hypothetical protein